MRFRLRAPGDGTAPGTVLVAWTADGDGPRGSGEEEAEDGAFTVEDVAPGRILLRIGAEGFLEAEAACDLAPGGEVDLGTLDFDPGRSIRGRIEDLEGIPVSGADIAVRGGAEYRWGEGASGADGRFLLEHQPSGPVQVLVWREGFLDLEAEIPPAAPDGEVRLVLRAGAVVRGRVRAPSGRPLRVSVEFVPESAADPEDAGEGSGTDARGGYEVRLPAGHYAVLIRHDAEEPWFAGRVEVTEGETRVLDLVLPE